MPAQPASLHVRQSPSSEPDLFSPNAPNRRLPVPLTGNPDFDFLLYLDLDLAMDGGAGAADLLNAAPDITLMDTQSFAKTFRALANQTRAIADSAGADNTHDRSARITARDSYFATSIYYRFTDFQLYGDPTDLRLPQLWAAQAYAFSHGLACLIAVTAKRFTLKTK